MIQEGVRLFEHLIVAVGINPEKKGTFSLEDRLAMLRESCRLFSNVEMASFSNPYLRKNASNARCSARQLQPVRRCSDWTLIQLIRRILHRRMGLGVTHQSLGDVLGPVFGIPALPGDQKEVFGGGAASMADCT